MHRHCDPHAPRTAHPTPPTPQLHDLPLERLAGAGLRRADDRSVLGDWFGCELSSVFQPVVDSAGGGIVGHEAFLRIHGGGHRELSPWALFSANADDQRLVALDRLARTVHTLNAGALGARRGLLFLNVHGRLLAAVGDDHGAAFRRVVEALGLDTGDIVIETPLAAADQPDLLAFVLRNYRQNGFQVAVNVESAAQWAQLAHGVPAQFVKIAGDTLCAGGETVAQAAARLHALKSARSDVRVVLTRLETPLATELAGAGVLVQGHAYGQPRPAA